MNRRRTAVAALSLLVPCFVQAQRRSDTSTVLGFRFFAKHYGDWLVAAFDSIPESKYAFRPTPTQQTVGHIAQHVEDANTSLCGRLGTMTHSETAEDQMPDSVRDH